MKSFFQSPSRFHASAHSTQQTPSSTGNDSIFLIQQICLHFYVEVQSEEFKDNLLIHTLVSGNPAIVPDNISVTLCNFFPRLIYMFVDGTHVDRSVNWPHLQFLQNLSAVVI